MERCTNCNQLLNEESFPRVAKGQPDRRGQCRGCIASAYARWAAENREVLLAAKRAYWHRRGRRLRDRPNDQSGGTP